MEKQQLSRQKLQLSKKNGADSIKTPLEWADTIQEALQADIVGVSEVKVFMFDK